MTKLISYEISIYKLPFKKYSLKMAPVKMPKHVG
jgi:hypothetical protein